MAACLASQPCLGLFEFFVSSKDEKRKITAAEASGQIW